MLRDTFNHGFTDSAWREAKTQARTVLADYAKRERTIAYSELVARISAIRLEAHEERLFHFLGEISEEEDEAGRGLLTVVVVHKTGDMSPGPGFYDLAGSRGRNVSDREKCWVEELNRVFAYWGKTGSPPASTQLETLPILIPEYSGSHPFSRSRSPQFYTLESLGDTAEGNTIRTAFFEKILVGIFWTIGKPVPYAFRTRNGEVRSLDAGCMKFLRNRADPELDFVCDDGGTIRSVMPAKALVSRYARMRETLVAQLSGVSVIDLPFDPFAAVDERRRMESEVVLREGQAEFRRQVLQAWGGRCAVTRTRVAAVLEAAHIHPFLGKATNDIRNGLALRADIHKLFDLYMLTVRVEGPDLFIQTSKALAGTSYEKLDGVSVALPKSAGKMPDRRCLEYHARRFAEVEAACS